MVYQYWDVMALDARMGPQRVTVHDSPEESPTVPASLATRVAFVLSEALYRRRWTQVMLAETTGLPKSNISRWLRGESDIKIDDVAVMAQALGMTLSQVFREAEALRDADLPKAAQHRRSARKGRDDQDVSGDA